MKKERNKNKYRIFYVFAILFIIGIFFDKNIADFFNSHQNKYIYSFMNFISLYAFLIPLFIIIYILISLKDKKNLIKFPIGFLLSVGIVYFLKFIVNRARPFDASDLNSFPSNHAAAVFSVLPLLKSNKFRIIWIIFSILVMISRLYLGRHYLTDVIAGAIIGYFASLGITNYIERRI